MFSNDLSRLISLCTILLAILAAPVMAGEPDHPVADAPAAYVDIDSGFSIVPPEDWEAVPDSAGAAVAFLSPLVDEADTLRENFNVTVLEIDELPEPQDLADGTFDSVRDTFDDLTLLSAENTILNGMPAVRIEYTCQYQEIDLQIVQYLVLTDGTDYVVTFTALEDTFEDYIPTFEVTAASLTSLEHAPGVEDDPVPVPAPADDDEDEAEEVVYVNEDLGFAMTLPVGWRLDLSNPSMLAVFMSPQANEEDQFAENMNLMAVDAQELPSASEYGEALVASMNTTLEGGELLTSEDLTINDFPAVRIEYGYLLQGHTIRASQHIILLGDFAVIVTSTATGDTFEAYKVDFDAAIDSLTLIGDE